MIRRIFDILFYEFGPQGWWPVNNKYNKKNFSIPENSRQRFEIILGAVLTQNTSWKNVEKALDNLRKNNLISPLRIVKSKDKKIAELILSAGYFNQKTKYLKNIAQFFIDNKKAENYPVNELRKRLLGVKGIGPETADSILLYAFKKPVFVVDVYTKRIFSRLGICTKNIGYSDLQDIFNNSLPKSVCLYNEYHALLVKLAKKNCSKMPVCQTCPLSGLCKKNL